LNQRKKKCSAKTVRKDATELRIVEIVEPFLAGPELLASLAVDLADHYKQTYGHGDEILKALEARRADVETKLANFVKAISQGIFNVSTAEAMNALEAQKPELDQAIQAEHVKATLYEDEASIGAFYKRFAEATIDTPETRDQLFEYFVDRIFIGRDQIVIASYYHDSAAPVEFEDLIDRVAGGARHLVDHHAGGPGDGVEQGGLADVRPPHQGDAVQVVVGSRSGDGGDLGQDRHSSVQDLPAAASVQSGDRVGLAEPQAPQGGGVALLGR